MRVHPASKAIFGKCDRTPNIHPKVTITIKKPYFNSAKERTVNTASLVNFATADTGTLKTAIESPAALNTSFIIIIIF
ncbi:MAG: hypothetical protein HC908_10440 [Calothrix sp. SM1_7_51]|nr:hypothetical protein [Calothrix sp. SM1_7_51]